MVGSDGRPKGLQKVFQERGFATDGKSRQQLVDLLSKCDDFASEKNEIECLFALSNHKVIYANLRKSKSHKLRLSEDKRLDGLARRTKKAF